MAAISSVSLSKLGGFPKPYLESVIGDDTGPRALLPRRALLVTKAEEVARPVNPGFDLPDAIARRTPPFSRSVAWKKRVEILALERCSLILAMPRVGCRGGSMAQLLKCVTAAKLAQDLELQGIPAVPVCWLIMHGSEPGGVTDELGGDFRTSGTGPEKFIEKFRYLLKSSLKKEDVDWPSEPPASACPASLVRCFWTWLGRDFGWLVADPGIARLQHSDGGSTADTVERPANLTGTDVARATGYLAAGENPVASIMQLAPDLPIAAIVVGPDDYHEADRIVDQIEAAACPKPALFPRVSATFLDRRSGRIMRKYGFRLRDLLADGEAQAAASRYDRDPSTIVGSINAAARSVGTAIEELAAGLAGRPRLSRKIRANGARVLFQMKKVEARARLAFENREAVLKRHAARLKARIAPEGSLQEDSLGIIDLFEWFPPAALSELYRQADIWNCQHQLICSDGES